MVTANDIIIPAESVLIILRFVSSRVCVNQCGPQTTSPCIAFRAISSPAPVSFSVSRSPTRDAQPRHTKKECGGSLSSEIVLSRLTAAASVRTCDAVSAGWLVMIKWRVEAAWSISAAVSSFFRLRDSRNHPGARNSICSFLTCRNLSDCTQHI